MCFIIFLKHFQKYKYVDVGIGSLNIKAKISDTLTKKIIGLMYEKNISSKEGMIFIFNKETNIPIWMRNMKFSIDVLWLDSNKKIVHIEKNLKPARMLDFRTYGGHIKARYVVEIKSGLVKKHHINRNSEVSINL
jgi:uncharacterized membrane protein (UPF0127 family)